MVNSQPFKELGGAKSADQLPSSSPFGRPAGPFGEAIPQEYQPGELVMMSQGLYRVKAAEPLSMNLHMGMQGIIATGTSGTTLVIDIEETDPVFSDEDTGFQIPEGTKILLGGQGFNEVPQIVTLASRAEVGRVVGTITVGNTATNGKLVTIVDSAGLSKAYTAAAAEDLTSNPCKFKSGGDKQLVAESLVNCIADAEGGHNGSIITELDLSGADPVIRIISSKPGSGSHSITTNEANISTTGFAGTAVIGRLNATVKETINKPVETECTILFVPANSLTSAGATGAITLDSRTFGILESPDSRKIIYDIVWGISTHPKFISASGDAANTGVAGFDLQDSTTQSQHIEAGGATDVIDNNGSAFRLGGLGVHNDTTGDTYDSISIGLSGHGSGGYGYGFANAFQGLISPKIRVSQPRGKVRFVVDQMTGSNDSSKAGWLTATETAITAPNHAYRLITGSGGNDNTLPHFQLLQDTDESLRDPHILIVGHKYLFEEVSDSEVREMIRRSGRFNYKIVQDPGQMSGFSDGVTGPTEGWKDLVANQKSRTMSFEDYKRATEKVTDQTMNMLYGTRASSQARRGSDPRNRHRRI